jgi:Family of unknown function (DUF6454)
MPLAVMWIAVLAAFAAAAAQPSLEGARLELTARVAGLTRASQWTRVQAVPMRFRAFHPQGMVRIGAHLFVSSVEVSVPTRRYPAPIGGLDRDAGAGVGHLFQIDLAGNLIADLRLGEGTIYHPGGIDYDGRYIWVAVAEYRPNSRSIVYRVDPKTMTAVEVLRWADHLGAIVHDTDDDSLHAVSWGARAFYRWTLGPNGRVTDSGGTAESARTVNPSHYLDYQDCKYAGQHRMLCTGVTEIRASAEAPPFRLGGIDLVHLGDHRPVHQVPVLLWTPSGLDMTHNPVWLEPTPTGLRGYFMPEDDSSVLYTFDVRSD